MPPGESLAFRVYTHIHLHYLFSICSFLFFAGAQRCDKGPLDSVSGPSRSGFLLLISLWLCLRENKTHYAPINASFHLKKVKCRQFPFKSTRLLLTFKIWVLYNLYILMSIIIAVVFKIKVDIHEHRGTLKNSFRKLLKYSTKNSHLFFPTFPYSYPKFYSQYVFLYFPQKHI